VGGKQSLLTMKQKQGRGAQTGIEGGSRGEFLKIQPTPRGISSLKSGRRYWKEIDVGSTGRTETKERIRNVGVS